MSNNSSAYASPVVLVEHIHPSPTAPSISLIITTLGPPPTEMLSGLKELNIPSAIEILLGIHATERNSLDSILQFMREIKHESKVYWLNGYSDNFSFQEPPEKLLFLACYGVSRGNRYAWSKGQFGTYQSQQLRHADQLLQSATCTLVLPSPYQAKDPSFFSNSKCKNTSNIFGLQDLGHAHFTATQCSTLYWKDARKTETIDALLTTFWALPKVSWPLQCLLLQDGMKGAFLPQKDDGLGSGKAVIPKVSYEFQDQLNQFVGESMLNYFFQGNSDRFVNQPAIQSNVALGSMKKLNQDKQLVRLYFDRGKAIRWIPRLILAGIKSMFTRSDSNSVR